MKRCSLCRHDDDNEDPENMFSTSCSFVAFLRCARAAEGHRHARTRRPGKFVPEKIAGRTTVSLLAGVRVDVIAKSVLV